MKNVGRYPDTDRSLSHRALATNRLAEVSMTTEQIQQQLQGRIANYVTPSQVNDSASGKLTLSSLAADVDNYIPASDVGKSGTNTSGVASLTSGKIPSSQLPTASSYPRLYYLETSRPTRHVNVMTTATVFNSTEAARGSFTLSDPNYVWIPVFTGSVEVNIVSGSGPVQIRIKDGNNRVVAGGISGWKSGLMRVNIWPQSIPIAYIGGGTFTYYLSFVTGTGQVSHTSWEDSLMPRQVPWNG